MTREIDGHTCWSLIPCRIHESEIVGKLKGSRSPAIELPTAKVFSSGLWERAPGMSQDDFDFLYGTIRSNGRYELYLALKVSSARKLVVIHGLPVLDAKIFGIRVSARY